MSTKGGAIHIVLNEQAFAALVAGQVAHVRGVAADHMADIEIILLDIGWEAMFEAIREAMFVRGEPELKEADK